MNITVRNITERDHLSQPSMAEDGVKRKWELQNY